MSGQSHQVESSAPIGTPGTPWGAGERAEWVQRQRVQRSFFEDVARPVEALKDRYEVVQYGEISYPQGAWPLLACRTRDWRAGRPTVLVTGGVHGYETSGVHGALRFLQTEGPRFEDRWNVVVAPCVSPWGYETINRWNPEAVDPNRSFLESRPAQEAAALMDWVAATGLEPHIHLDLHETTDSDNTEFRPALAARDGRPLKSGPIPDGFYVVGPARRPELAFQEAVIASVAAVTHIAEPDDEGCIIGVPVSRPGVILYDADGLGLCMGLTHAPYTTTTEVYPDSPRTSPEACIQAQVAAVVGALRWSGASVA